MPLIPVSNVEDPRLAWYRGVADPVLLRQGGRFIAEGRRVVERLLTSPRWRVESVLVSPAAAAALDVVLTPHLPTLPVFVAALDRLVALAGYNIHRGCLAIGLRTPTLGVEAVVPAPGEPAWLLGLEGLADADNVGACFRNAAAFGIQAVVLDAGCADPLYRKAIRTSMGATLQVPFARVTDWPGTFARVREGGGVVVALTPSADAEDLGPRRPSWAESRRLLVLVGREGSGLDRATIAACDRRVRVPMAEGTDSINVAAASAVALHGLGGACRLTGRDD